MLPKRFPGFRRLSVLVLAAALSACGGGDSDKSASTERLYVMGDSLADAGTFGFKFTIQGNPIYPDLVAGSEGLDAPCNHYSYFGDGSSFDGSLFTQNSRCLSYAVMAGVINPASKAIASTTDPRALGTQLSQALNSGDYTARDMLLVDGGGNDTASLIGAYLKMGTDGGVSYVTLLKTVFDGATVDTAAAGGVSKLGEAGSTYMSALADQFHDQIVSLALDKGAQRVVVINMPDITYTPRFRFVLDAVEAAQGAAVRAASDALFKAWVQAFNTELASRFAGESRVVVVDLNTQFTDEVLNPAKYQLTNVTDAACPAVGVDSDGLPAYDFPSCTEANLAANPPAGVSDPQWYVHYLFSDSFHPTPYVHRLTADLIARSIAAAGWN